MKFLLAAIFLFMGQLGVGVKGQTSSLPREIREKPQLKEARLKKFSASILSFDIANQSGFAAVALADCRVQIWNLDSGNVIHEFSFPVPETDKSLKVDGNFEPISVRFSPDGKDLAVSFLSKIHIYDVDSWKEKLSLGVSGEDEHRADLKITPAAPQLKKRSAQQAEAEKNKPLPTLNDSARAWAFAMERGDGRTRITDLKFTADGGFIIAAYCRGGCFARPGSYLLAFPSGRDSVRLWDLRTATVKWEQVYDAEGVVNRIVPSLDGKHFAVVDAHLGRCAIGVCRLDDGGSIFSRALGPCSAPPSIQFLHDGSSFIANRIDEGNRKNQLWRGISVYETNTGKKIEDLSDGNGGGVRETDISTNHRWLVSIVWRGRQFQVWDLEKKKAVVTAVPQEWRRASSPFLDRLRLSPDGRWMVVGSDISGDLAVYQFEN